MFNKTWKSSRPTIANCAHRRILPLFWRSVSVPGNLFNKVTHHLACARAGKTSYEIEQHWYISSKIFYEQSHSIARNWCCNEYNSRNARKRNNVYCNSWMRIWMLSWISNHPLYSNGHITRGINFGGKKGKHIAVIIAHRVLGALIHVLVILWAYDMGGRTRWIIIHSLRCIFMKYHIA